MFEFKINLANLLIIASVFIGLTFGFLLIFARRLNHKANRMLGLAAIVIVLWNVWVLSHDLNIFRYIPKFYLIPLNFSLALGPLIYFYTRHMTDADFKLTSKHWLHFMPLLLELGIHILICIEAVNGNILASSTKAFFSFMPIVQLLAIISVVAYGLKSLKEINTYELWLKANYSNDSKYSLKWLYRLLVIFSILWLLWIPYTFVDYFVYDFNLGIADYYPLYILMSLITIWISAEAFLKPEIIHLEAKSKNLLEKVAPTQEIIDQAQWLKEQMLHNLFYLDADLTLSSLAEAIEIHPNKLSKIINDGLAKNFSDFVNEYRVQAVIARLNDPKYDTITLLGISFDCGFNSKTTFNRVFKNSTGVTPFDYKKSISK